jgi:anti-sigma regulatory factor (Ser/Thr protein kinase)
VSDAWSGPDGHTPGQATVQRRGAWLASPSTERNGGSPATRGASARRAAPTPGSRGPHDRRRPGPREEPSSCRIAPGTTAPRRAREVVASRLTDHLDGERLDDAVLLVSELVTNSILHAELDDEGWIDLTVTLGSEAVRVEVADSGPGFGAQGHERPPPERITGRGLFLVRKLSDRCGVAATGTSRVWFELDR